MAEGLVAEDVYAEVMSLGAALLTKLLGCALGLASDFAGDSRLPFVTSSAGVSTMSKLSAESDAARSSFTET